MYKVLSFIILLFIVSSCDKKGMFEAYKTEISNLKTEKERDHYWKKLYVLDQDVLLFIQDQKKRDSLSLCNMARTAIMFETHGSESYKSNNTVPILNLSHNLNGEALLAFWPIIIECKNTGGVIETMGGGYPAYQLEGISLTFYGYSLYKQDEKYSKLVDKLNGLKSSKSVSENLNIAYINQKEKEKLTEAEVLGKWTNQPFENKKADGFFEFVTMSDNNLYVKQYDRIQKLILLETTSDSQLYKVEHEPFGWYYELKNNGELSLKDDENLVLINYTKHI